MLKQGGKILSSSKDSDFPSENKEAKSSPRPKELGFASQTRRIKMLELIPASAIIAIVVIALIVIF